MTDSRDKELFSLLCGSERESLTGNSIGTYNEKSLHRILKRFFCDDPECFEVKVGGYLADIVRGGEIVEIQTGSLYPLQKKLSYYLGNTDLAVRIVHPMISHKKILRVDKESGEILRERRSPKHKVAKDILPELLWLSDMIKSERMCIDILLISVTEHRYSDTRARYRKSGAYDSQTFPEALEDRYLIRGTDDVKALVAPELLQMHEGFTASSFGKVMGFSGRKTYSALSALCQLGLIEKGRREGNAAALYRPIKEN